MQCGRNNRHDIMNVFFASIQVLQFGRIDNGCFILDFQAPFSPIQAFATALANLVWATDSYSI